MNQTGSLAHVAVAVKDHGSLGRIEAALRSDASFKLTGEASDSLGLMELLQRVTPDILIVDAELGDNLHYAFLSSATRIVLMAERVDQKCLIQALDLEAYGLVRATAPPQIIVNCIHTVLGNEHYLEADGLALVLTMLRQLLGRSQAQSKSYLLTSRESSIVSMVAAGCSNRQISLKLSISERTVKHHLTHVFAKLGLSSRLQLANFALTHGLYRDADRFVPGAPRASERPSFQVPSRGQLHTA